jgi:fermentation-respiration switch protein FrsA (DUF1100 family)
MLIWPLVLVVSLLAGLWIFQRHLIYLPTGTVPPIADVLPGWSEETIATQDGLKLLAWYRTPESGKPVVVVLPGNAGNRSDRAPLGARLAEEGYGVLLIDYRGYGGNPGHPSEGGLELDARAASSFVREQAPGHDVILFGESLGAAVAIGLAVDEPPAVLILRSPFTSLADAAAEHYPFLPVRVLLRDRYPSYDRIGGIQSPVLVVAGTEDSIVPLAQSRTIYELAPHPKEWLSINNADHNDYELLAGTTLVSTVVRFVEDALAD